MSKFDLGDYVDVKERIRLFYERFPDGSVMTTEVRATRDPDDVPRIWVEARAYRSAADDHPGVGWSWMVLPGATSYTKGSELENTETSAWGRAIGSVGIGIAGGIASADEVRAKGGTVKADVEHGDDGSLIGTAEVGDKQSSDFMLRQTPEGAALGFRLRGGRGGILVECRGALADQLAGFRDAVVGQKVTVWGTIGERSWTPRGKSAPVTFQVLAADRVSVPGVGVLPTDTTPEPVGAPGPDLAGTEAPSAPLFDDDEQAAIDEALGVTVG